MEVETRQVHIRNRRGCVEPGQNTVHFGSCGGTEVPRGLKSAPPKRLSEQY
jgi:hypothetical protein